MSEESRAIYEMGLTPGTGYVAGPEGRKAQNIAIETGKEQCHRSIINIVGKERQGKTSLRKALSRQAFDPNEVSTVGIDHDFVDASHVNDAWQVIDNSSSNEFEEAVGEHTLRILKPKGLSKTHKKAFHYAKTMIKIFLITSTKMLLYYVGMRCGLPDLLPWFAFLLIGTFGISAVGFGVRDGFGIAIGIYALAVLSDAIIRFRLHESLFLLSDNYGALTALVASFLIGASVDSFIGLSFGASLGTGMAISLCVMVPPSLSETEFTFFGNEGIYHVFLFMIGTLVGLGSHKETGFHSYIIVPIISVAHEMNSSSRVWLYSFILGLGVGITHGNGLFLGRQLYVSLFGEIKAKFGKQGWRFFTYVAGIPSGILLALICGWQWPSGYSLQYVFATLFVVMVELLHISYGSRGERKTAEKGTETSSSGSVKSSHVIKALVMPRKRTKLTIRDFAGHPLYHFAHHIFMYSQSIYIVVFNLLEAKADIDAAFQTILYWLNSIDTHTEHPNASIFIVGTHRDSVSPGERANIANSLTKRLPRKYRNIVVWNDNDNSPLFQIENSVDRTSADEDLNKLRREVWHRAKNADYMKREWPIKYWAFLNEIRAQREKGVFVGDYSHFLQIVLQDPLYKMNSETEFQEMLNFYQKIGEIIYQCNDDELKQVIIFEPKFLIDVMAAIVNIPPVAKQEYGYKDQWHELEETGICREGLLRHVIERAVQSPSRTVECGATDRVVDSVLWMLQSNDLLCKIASPESCIGQTSEKLTEDGSPDEVKTDSETLYAVPKLLPAHNPDMHLCDWESRPEDIVLYVDFGLFHPQAVFLRLICQCLRRDHDVRTEHGDLNASMFNDFGSFQFSDDIIYKLRLRSEQNAIEVVVRSAPRSKPVEVVLRLQERLQKIIKRDFEKCNYTMGPICPCPSPHDIPKTSRGTKSIHILKMFDASTKADENMLSSMTFWCNGRRVQVRDGKAYQEKPPENGRHRTPQRFVRRDTHVKNLPHDLYRYICNALNIRQTLGSDWTGLAAVIGKTADEVHLLAMESNPCDALLRDWGNSGPGANISHLIELLDDPEFNRNDLITHIEGRLL
ncbi:uncharacterized protein [Ptychodera flava]|uniref:uncharacterized protein n=1 Tax=Ptychodera flava TaxID=63121 RepID=UPI00396A0F68